VGRTVSRRETGVAVVLAQLHRDLLSAATGVFFSDNLQPTPDRLDQYFFHNEPIMARLEKNAR
jgi:hypothetical protein